MQSQGWQCSRHPKLDSSIKIAAALEAMTRRLRSQLAVKVPNLTRRLESQRTVQSQNSILNRHEIRFAAKPS